MSSSFEQELGTHIPNFKSSPTIPNSYKTLLCKLCNSKEVSYLIIRYNFGIQVLSIETRQPFISKLLRRNTNVNTFVYVAKEFKAEV